MGEETSGYGDKDDSVGKAVEEGKGVEESAGRKGKGAGEKGKENGGTVGRVGGRDDEGSGFSLGVKPEEGSPATKSSPFDEVLTQTRRSRRRDEGSRRCSRCRR